MVFPPPTPPGPSSIPHPSESTPFFSLYLQYKWASKIIMINNSNINDNKMKQGENEPKKKQKNTYRY